MQTADSNETHWHRHESKIMRLDEINEGMGIDIKWKTKPRDTPNPRSWK